MSAASIIVPAHNEERSIAKLLALLTEPTNPDLEILVVCNGCSDRTAEVARTYEPRGVRVIEVAEASKHAALKRGDVEATNFPRLYIDSDVEIDWRSVLELVARLGEPKSGLLAAAPVRVIPREGVSLPVRWYYDVWEQLPQVRESPFGRGVVALSQAGFDRVRNLPAVMSDDLAMAAALTPAERTVVPSAKVLIWPPRTVRDLIRRRVRVATGNAQLDQNGGRGAELRTSPRDLVAIATHRPRSAPKVAVFLLVTVLARIGARRQVKRGDFTTWLRDESSRSTQSR